MVPAGRDPGAHEVDVGRIERELVRLLNLPENRSPNGQPAVRTAVLNLVAYASDATQPSKVGMINQTVSFFRKKLIEG